MSNYSTIKELVIDACISEGKFPSYEKLTNLVLKYFPSSKWQKTHYDWYKSKIKLGKIKVPGQITDMDNESEAIESDVEDTIEASLSLEKDLHLYLAQHVCDIESGLTVVDGGVEYQTEAGRIDILARDDSGFLVVIEIKAGKAKDSAIGQLLGYMGCAHEFESQKSVRGILVASDFDKRVIYAAKNLPHIKLVKYQVAFHLYEIT